MKKAVLVVIGLLIVFSCFATTAFANQHTEKHYLGEVVESKEKNGYQESLPIVDSGNLHYGWNLGEFYMTGYSGISNIKGKTTFLKTVGDDLTLKFDFLQTINISEKGNLQITSINREKLVYVNEDTDGGYYAEFGYSKQNGGIGWGALFVQHTDYQNKKGEPTVYTNYLKAVALGTNDTNIVFYEEGDYKVSLIYELAQEGLLPKITNYKITFEFSVRNGNAMVYPFDCGTGAELTNSHFTTNGFRLDFAQSHYLDVYVKRDVLVEAHNGEDWDTRFNKVVQAGDSFTDEGVYTITVINKDTNQETIKKIYVGTNKICKAYVATGLSVTEIRRQLSEGAQIDENGQIVPAGTSGGENNQTLVVSLSVGACVLAVGTVVFLIVKKKGIKK